MASNLGSERLRGAVAWLAAALAITSPAMATPGAPTSHCDVALVACETAEGASVRAERLARLRASVHEAALAEVDVGIAKEEHPDGPDPLTLARIREVGRRIAPFEAPLTDLFAEVRAAAERVVRRRDMTPQRRDAALARLAAVHLRWADVEAYEADPDSSLSTALLRGCGRSLLRDEGWVSRDWRQVIVCPGFLLLEAEREDGSPELTAESSAFLVAHELGHVVEMSANDPEAEEDADAWGNEILRELVAARVARGGDARAITARALRSFCDLEGDPVHDRGTERAARAAAALSSLLCT